MGPSNTRRLEDISVPRCQDMEYKEIELEPLVRAQDVENFAVLPLV